MQMNLLMEVKQFFNIIKYYNFISISIFIYSFFIYFLIKIFYLFAKKIQKLN
jgi:hypothetical protein